jgi:hypothetical protein
MPESRGFEGTVFPARYQRFEDFDSQDCALMKFFEFPPTYDSDDEAVSESEDEAATRPRLHFHPPVRDLDVLVGQPTDDQEHLHPLHRELKKYVRNEQERQNRVRRETAARQRMGYVNNTQ